MSRDVKSKNLSPDWTTMRFSLTLKTKQIDNNVYLQIEIIHFNAKTMGLV